MSKCNGFCWTANEGGELFSFGFIPSVIPLADVVTDKVNDRLDVFVWNVGSPGLPNTGDSGGVSSAKGIGGNTEFIAASNASGT